MKKKNVNIFDNLMNDNKNAKIITSELADSICEIVRQVHEYEKEHPEAQKYCEDLLAARETGAYYERLYWKKVVAVLTFLITIFGSFTFTVIITYLLTL